ncbi:MAG: hypothetical protein Edafosvirus6_2 [Edafosvirus sp.]|uniref:Uncharacterized protein n=1 Tax=Edafosvirus sp. TaxID=2487765 RepID=A0A3G4ZX34_9VIRU|nr:MAG: hypothetical protein Edafosvirus6_2 [Edafosvirus sp.]
MADPDPVPDPVEFTLNINNKWNSRVLVCLKNTKCSKDPIKTQPKFPYIINPKSDIEVVVHTENFQFDLIFSITYYGMDDVQEIFIPKVSRLITINGPNSVLMNTLSNEQLTNHFCCPEFGNFDSKACCHIHGHNNREVCCPNTLAPLTFGYGPTSYNTINEIVRSVRCCGRRDRPFGAECCRRT